MKLSIIFVVLACLVQVKCRVLSSPNQSSSSDILKTLSRFDCSTFINDREILNSFTYYVPLYSSDRKNLTNTETYALMDKNGFIYYMNIVNQQIIPSTIFCLKHLQELNIRSTCSCQANRRLSTKIERLPLSLTYLKIDNTEITHWSEDFGKLTQLHALELTNTGLMSLPDAVSQLSSLQILLLPKNNLTSLPPGIKKLRSLKKITLTNNPNLQYIQELNDLPSLETLDARYCSIVSLARDLPQLTVLHMSNNNLTNLDGIQTLGTGTDNKKFFYFDYNYISSITPEIRYVHNLFWLNLNNNKLTTLPRNICFIDTLGYLYVKNNLLQDIKLEIIKIIFILLHPNLKFFF